MDLSGVPLSVLDLAPVPAGAGATEALVRSADLARHVEQLGYKRFWVAEHHNMASIASSSPSVLIGHLADVTEKLRVGSGGVMLPNHPSLVVAEQFRTLEALHPGRIDLGIGRAPGTDPLTAAALRRPPAQLSASEFPLHLSDLLGFLEGQLPADHPYASVRAMPMAEGVPEVWLLGSSDYSARLAGMLSMPFAFAHHFSSANSVAAMEFYRRSFRPSEAMERPHSMVAVTVICAETDEHALYLAGPSRLSFLRLRLGTPGPLPSPEEAASYAYDEAEEKISRARLSGQAVGSPDTVRERLKDILESTGADELMATCMLYDHEDRLRSYELLAKCVMKGPPSSHHG